MFSKALINSTKKLLSLKRDKLLENFSLIGGIALSAYLEPRATGDIDYAVKLKDEAINEVANRLRGKAYKGDVFDPLAGTISWSITVEKATVPIQLVRFHPALESLIFENSSKLTFSGQKIPILNPRGLILLKLYAGGAIDMDDARKLYHRKEVKPSDRKYIEGRASSLRILGRLRQIA